MVAPNHPLSKVPTMRYTTTHTRKSHHESICHCGRVRVDSRRDRRCTRCRWVVCSYGDCKCNYPKRLRGNRSA